MRRRLEERIPKGRRSEFAKALEQRSPGSWASQYFQGRHDLRAAHLERAAAFAGLTLGELIAIEEPGRRTTPEEVIVGLDQRTISALRILEGALTGWVPVHYHMDAAKHAQRTIEEFGTGIKKRSIRTTT